MRYIFEVILIWLCCPLSAQEDDDWLQLYRQVEDIEDEESESWEETCEMLSSLATEPLDINEVTREELEALPFLSAQQVEDIMEYRYKHGALRTIGELQMIPSLDYDRRRLLQCFVMIDNNSQRETTPRIDSLLKWGKHNVTFSMRIPFYKREGDINGYLGYPYKHTFRYQFKSGNRLQFGIVGAQDAGEPFFAHDNKWGYDHYSYYFLIRQRGMIETLALGQYRLSFGMGLVMNGGFYLGKQAMLSTLGRTTNVIRANSSRMESGYMQGAAVTIKTIETGRSKVNVTAYASCRAMDGTLNKKDGSVATLLTDGYHRTPKEMEKKNNVTMTDVGAHVDWRISGLNVGATVAYTHLNRQLSPDTSYLYRRYYPAGTDFVNASIDYRYNAYRLSINGETAIDKDGRVATINAISYQPSQTISVMALQRFYSYQYNCLHARSFATGSRTQNESGIYVGVTWHPTPHFLLTAYTDYAYFAWAKYQASRSSYAWDHFVSATYTGKRWKLQARYRLKRQERDNEDKTAFVMNHQHRGRLSLINQVTPMLTLQTQADMAYVGTDGYDFGYMVSEHVGLQISSVKLDAGIGYFHTDSYEARLYMYEHAPLHHFTFPMFYGEGIRYWLMGRAKLGERWTLTAKLGTTNLFDRSTMGTGKEKVNHSAVTDLDIELSVKI